VACERSVDRAGLDEQDPDAVLADLVVQRLGVALDETLMMRPCRCARMCGRTALVIRMTP
jgi:hypothetical protein